MLVRKVKIWVFKNRLLEEKVENHWSRLKRHQLLATFQTSTEKDSHQKSAPGDPLIVHFSSPKTVLLLVA